MDTPTIAAYYREQDPMKRRQLLETSIQEGEEPEQNAIRRELWEIRYKENSEVEPGSKADGFLGLWMSMEFNQDAAGRLFGAKSARRELTKQLEKLEFARFQTGDELHQELLYRECCHMVKTYMELCETDKSYNTTLFGILSVSKDKAKEKLKTDVYKTAVALPGAIHMEQELGIITRAAKEMYELHFPGEGSLTAAE
jgi:hypothetical protein